MICLLSKTVNSCSAVEWPVIKPYYFLLKRLFSFIYPVMCSLTNFFQTFTHYGGKTSMPVITC